MLSMPSFQITEHFRAGYLVLPSAMKSKAGCSNPYHQRKLVLELGMFTQDGKDQELRPSPPFWGKHSLFN